MTLQFIALENPRDMWKTINFGSGAQSVEYGHILSAQVRTMPVIIREIVAWYDIYWKFLWNH
jgi:hypothetical protein